MDGSGITKKNKEKENKENISLLKECPFLSFLHSPLSLTIYVIIHKGHAFIRRYTSISNDSRRTNI